MKRLFILLLFFFTVIAAPSVVSASPSETDSDNHTAREEAEGKEIWEKFQAKQITCRDLTDENFGALGEYFMGQSIGDTQRHAAMNQMMTNMMGEKGEEQMHIILGKRSSGCDTETKGGGNPMMGNYGWNNMMGGANGFGVLGWLPMLVFWLLLILGVIALVRYLGKSGQHENSKTPLDILKERYAKGEIDKKEFERMKKEIV